MFESQKFEFSDASASLCHMFQPAATSGANVMTSLEQQLTLLKLAKSDAGRAVYYWDLEARRFHWSSNLSHILPFAQRQSIAGESDLLALIHPEDREQFLQMRHSLDLKPSEFSFTCRLMPGDGEVYHIRLAGAPASGDGSATPMMFGLIELESAAAASLAYTTALPHEAGLFPYNYPQAFITRLQQMIESSKQQDKIAALLMVSIDNLAMIINGYGTQVSERVISSLIGDIQTIVAAVGTIERLHREQIGIILSCATKEDVHALTDRIHAMVRNYSHHSAAGAVHVLCSVASVDFPTNASAADALDKTYIALSNPHGFYYRSFEDMQDAVIQSRQQMGLANYLRKAIDENRIRLAFQPVIESKTGRIVHYEALLRLIGEDGKISSAGALIPIAERMGLIDVIDKLVLEMVIEELKAAPELTLAFNISNMTTDNPKWLAHFTALLKDNLAIAQRMIIEITETAAQRDLRRTAYFVASVQALGAQVALDDFGSGYTSFRQLKALSVDMVKIDGAFVKDLVDNPDNRFFVKTLLEFTNGFGLRAVAEFVENGDCAKMLMELGVEYMQGYYFGRPENHRGWLKEGEFKKS